MNTFKCELCGDNHQFHTLIESVQPEIIGNITSGVLNKKLEVLAKSIFLVDREFVIAECEMSIGINDLDDQLDLYVWIKVDAKVLYEIIKAKGKSGIICTEGKIAVEIPFYNNVIGDIVEIEIDLDNDEPGRVRKINQNGKLKVDFEEGIDSSKMKVMLTKAYHAEQDTENES